MYCKLCKNPVKTHEGVPSTYCSTSCSSRSRKLDDHVSLVGKKFGILTVVNFGGFRVIGTANVGRINAYWICLCSCGNKVEYFIRQVEKGHCGCLTKLLQSKPRKVKQGSAFNHVFRSYKMDAAKRGLCFNLTEDQFRKLCQERCHYCGALPEKKVSRRHGSDFESFVYNGIDRKHNSLGYTLENSLPCCQIDNIAKSSRSYESYIAHLNRVTHYRVNLNE